MIVKTETKVTVEMTGDEARSLLEELENLDGRTVGNLYDVLAAR